MSKDLPIIFSGPMVRALLEGRKTQTRRVLTPQPEPFKIDNGDMCEVGQIHVVGNPRPRVTLDRVITRQEVRYAVGDRLWVREAVARIDNSEFGQESYWQYRADTDGVCFPGDWPPEFKDDPDRPRWRPSIHMPRIASRLTLIVTGVKVERLNDITDDDAKAEGIAWCSKFEWWHCDPERDGAGPGHGRSPADAFLGLWSMLHGAESVGDNPFVVAINFRVLKANIDAPEARAAA